MSRDINDIAIITVKGVDYCCIIYGVSKFDTTLVLKKSMLHDPGI